VKIFNWLFTMYKGRVRFTLPMLWTVAFMITFVIGGMTGVMLALPGADFVLHNSLFLIAHFHNVIIGGVLFGCFAAMNYWFPKATGFFLNEKLGKASFWCWVIGFYVAFMPLYALGLMGATRRLQHYAELAWQPYFVVACVGAVLILFGILFQVAQIVVSIRDRNENRDLTGDPWNGRTLEWATSSPAAYYNFAQTPRVEALDAWHDMKKKGISPVPETFQPIHMPRNTWAGPVIGLLALPFGFGMIWHIWWMAILFFVAMIGSAIVHSFDQDRDYYVPADEVAEIEGRNAALAKAA
jgi:cytochrome o ubiquinol oxidase subunit I